MIFRLLFGACYEKETLFLALMGAASLLGLFFEPQQDIAYSRTRREGLRGLVLQKKIQKSVDFWTLIIVLIVFRCHQNRYQ